MQFIYVIILTLASLTVMFFLTKLIGNRQLSQMSMFDYINGITIGSIAAELATNADNDFWKPLTAMIIYAAVVTGIDLLMVKNIRCREFIGGKSYVLMKNGRLNRRAFKESRIDIDEFLSQCRVGGYFNIDELDGIILESGGELSFLPKTENEPYTAKDAGINPAQKETPVVVISDGRILEGVLKSAGFDMVWLDRELARLGIGSAADVFLGTAAEGRLTAFRSV